MDEALEVTVPSFCFNGYLILHSLTIWGLGAFFLLYGCLIHHVLDNFFLDDYGLKTSGTIAYLSMAVGVALVLASYVTNFVVMYPSVRNYGLLAILIGSVLVFVLIFCIVGFYYTPHLNGVMRVGFRQIMHNYNARSQINTHLDGLQTHVKCCGAEDYSTWFATSWANGRKIVPVSCCKNLKYCHNLEPLIISDIYEKGCYKVFDDYSTILDGSYIGTIIGSIVIDFLAIIAAIKMALRYKAIRVVDSVIPIV